MTLGLKCDDSVLVEITNTVAKSGLDNCLSLDLDCSSVLFSDHPDLIPVIAVAANLWF